VGRFNEYQPKGGDALRLGSKGRYGSCVGDPLVTRGPYLSALEIRSLYIKRYINSPSFLIVTLSFGLLHVFKTHHNDGRWTLSEAFLKSIKFTVTGLCRTVTFSVI